MLTAVLTVALLAQGVDAVPARASDVPTVGPLTAPTIVYCNTWDLSDRYYTDAATCSALRRLEALSVAELAQVRGVAADANTLLVVARDDVRAYLLLRLFSAMAKDDVDRTPDERLAVAWLVQVRKKYSVEVAQAAKHQFDLFEGDGRGFCTYTPPFPYEDEYPTAAGREPICSIPDFFFVGPEYPEFDSFQKWGAAEVVSRMSSPAKAASAARIAVSMQSLAAAVATGVSTAVVFAAIGIGAALGLTSVIWVPVTLSNGWQFLDNVSSFNAGAYAGAAAIIVAAIVIAVFAGIRASRARSAAGRSRTRSPRRRTRASARRRSSRPPARV